MFLNLFVIRNKMPNTKETTSNDNSNSQNTAYNPRKAREGEDNHDGDLPNLCPPDSPPCMPNFDWLLEKAGGRCP